MAPYDVCCPDRLAVKTLSAECCFWLKKQGIFFLSFCSMLILLVLQDLGGENNS
jgi:hypothetical protein